MAIVISISVILIRLGKLYISCTRILNYYFSYLHYYILTSVINLFKSIILEFLLIFMVLLSTQVVIYYYHISFFRRFTAKNRTNR